MMTLHHIAILASERERSLAFYGALGFEVQSCHPRPERQDEIIFLQQGCMTLELFVTAGRPARPSWPEAYGLRHLALRTGDAAAVRDLLLAAGYQPEELRQDALTGETLFFVLDPDGLPIEIYE